MKNPNSTLKIACWLIVAACAVWLGIYGYQAVNDPYRTVPVTAVEYRDAVRVQGVVVRDEEVLCSVYNSVRARLKEGERVPAGGVVAEAYDSDEALLGAVRLAELRAEAEDLTALLALASGENSQQADAEILSGIRRLRTSVAAGNFTEAESLTQTLQTRVFAAFRSADEIRGRLQTVRTEIQELSAKYEGGGTPITSPVSGLFSASADGWEDLGSEDLKDLTPSALSAMLSEKRQAPAWSLGKVVSGVRWYLAALADDCHERNSPMDPNRLLIIARKACYGACGWMGSFTRATNSRTHDQKHGNATFSANVLKSDEQAVKTWFSAF